MVRYGRTVARFSRTTVSDIAALGVTSTVMRIQGPVVDWDAPPIISMHGYTANGAAQTLEQMRGPSATNFPVDALLATGRTIYFPWSGNSFGHESDSYPAVGGHGANSAIEAMYVAINDFPGQDILTTGCDMVGGSMGACNAVRFMQADFPIRKAVLYVPLIDLSVAWDLGGDIQTAAKTVWGAADRASFLAATVDADPSRTDCSVVDSGRTIAIAASNDSLIPYAGVVSWCAQWGVPLTTTASNHLSLDDPAVDEVGLILDHLAVQ